MLPLEKRIEALVCLGDRLRSYVNNNGSKLFELETLIKSQHTVNSWFIEPFVLKAVNHWAEMLSRDSLSHFVERYPGLKQDRPMKKVAVIPAENVPLAGMHDLVMVLLAGHQFYAKNINCEADLLQFITSQLISIEPGLNTHIFWGIFPKDVDSYLLHSKHDDKTLMAYFEHRKSLIRQKKISVAVISPNDTHEHLKLLGTDMFSYFGLDGHCVRKLFIPKNFSVNRFFEPIEEFSYLYQYNRYANNYDYHKSVFMMDRIPFFDNGFVALRESAELHVPIGCIYFEYYDVPDEVSEKIRSLEPYIQRIVTNIEGYSNAVSFGNAHNYPLWEFDDHKETIAFLLN